MDFDQFDEKNIFGNPLILIVWKTLLDWNDLILHLG